MNSKLHVATGENSVILPKLTAHQSFTIPANLARGLVPSGEIVPQVCGCGGGTCSCQYGPATGYLYTVGKLVPFFPSLSVEKEFDQAAAEEQMVGQDEEKIFKVFSDTDNRYLAREMLWTLQLSGVDMFILKPDSEQTLTQFIASLNPNRPQPSYDVFLGKFVPMAADMAVHDEMLPLAVCLQTFSISENEMTSNIQRAISSGISSSSDVVQYLLTPMMDVAQNPGNNDALRALNFVILTQMDLYSILWQILKGTAPGPKDSSGFCLENVEVVPSNLQGTRLIFDIIFSFRGNATNLLTKWFCRVDTTGAFPTLITKMQRYYGTPGMMASTGPSLYPQSVPSQSPFFSQGLAPSNRNRLEHQNEAIDRNRNQVVLEVDSGKQEDNAHLPYEMTFAEDNMNILEKQYGIGETVKFSELNSCIGIVYKLEGQEKLLGIHLVIREPLEYDEPMVEAVKTVLKGHKAHEPILVLGCINIWAEQTGETYSKLLEALGKFDKKRAEDSIFQAQLIGEKIHLDIQKVSDGHAAAPTQSIFDLKTEKFEK